MDFVEPADRPPGGSSTGRREIGPLDEDTVRPLRGLLTAKLAAMAVLVLAAIGAGILLAPQVGTGLGLVPQVPATVVSIDPLPANETASGAQCTRERVQVSWGSGNRGSFVTCGVANDAAGAPRADMRVSVGDIVPVRAVAGWQSVVTGPRSPNVIVALVLAAVIALAIVGGVRYLRERREIAGLVRAPIKAEPLHATRIGFAMAFDALSLGKGKRAMLRMRFDDAALRPLRLQVAGATAEAMRWRDATVYPTGRTRSGAAAGPYVIETPGGLLLAAGRRLRRRPQSPPGQGPSPQ